MDIADKIYIGVMTLLIMSILIINITTTILPYTNEEITTITIKDKFIKNYNKTGTYLVVDNDNNTYCIEDLLFKGKFNSTDIYNQLELNKTYKIKTSGHRIQLLSMYKNINEILEGE